ncbi:AcvB/VirJ family lysyl-phosphatidylglycerol hydrolase [Pedobacter sp. UBA5917]|jgi:type IV secretory pathway VirJ component|uniref:AcvB/VirJ family lysyl-phosphatidylglycerol hydrolase n=1 Tax=Pedobacter sp. UBA5917 TaxID=1947061 RepID=UPI0025D0003E|nr:AcvB/VirJ family lysyl-phosphatidylglycerol hydrolase [Pedobacter sp. UBA5917]
MKKAVFFLLLSIVFSSCALFKRARVHENNAIKGNEFNLPIFLYPAKDPQAKKLLIFLSGDGGWIKFEDDLSLKFAENGFHTIGINSRDYFWEQKTPEQTEKDIVQLIRKYALKYKTREVYLCGYSFGADVLPFIYSRLPFRAKRHVRALQMLSPYATTSFKVHFGDLANLSGDNYPYKVDLEINKIAIPIYCFYGIEEEDKPLKKVKQKNLLIDSIPGNHHYQTIAYDKIVSVLK